MEHGLLSLLPPLLALALVLVTKRIIVSLGAGIIVGALMVNQTEELFINEAVADIASIVAGIFVVDGSINTWEFYIILFLLILGMIASLITITGGSRAFGEWALTRVKSRVGAQITSGILGLIVFIDDYFNCIIVGNVSRPFTDRHKVSRAKLAYAVDSTAAPVCVISPVSSWGAYIITIIGGILTAHGITEYGALQAFLYMAPMNFYAVFAILLVFAVAYFKLDFGLMRTHEKRAVETGELTDTEKGMPPGESEENRVTADGQAGDLIWPILTLVVATVAFMVVTGIQATEGAVTLLAAFENTDVAASLLYGGLISLAVTIVISFLRSMPVKHFSLGLWLGIKSMMPAVLILIFAWTIIEIINELGTGEYLASAAEGNIQAAYLPAIFFVVAGLMSFSTGTSWGTFAIMLPIGGEMAAVADVSLMLPVLAAVLAGSIFGDHCSPISDTTILASTGAGSHLIDHVLTQLPYALLTAVVAAVSFLVLGLSGSVMIGLLAGAVLFVMSVVLLKLFINIRYAHEL